MPQQIPADPSCVCTALRKATRAVTNTYDHALADTGMTIAQFAILRNIARAGDIPLSRLADMLVMDRTSLYRAVAPLEAKGWVKVAAAVSGRARIASLTDAGDAAMLNATGPWRAAQARMIGTLGEARWADLQDALSTVTAIAGGAR